MPHDPQSSIDDQQRARALDSVRILTVSNDVARQIDVPTGYTQRGRLLFTVQQGDRRPRADEILRLASRRGLDVVLVRYEPSSGVRAISVGLGIWLWDRMAWCGETQLWRPSDAELCVLVPTMDALARHYSIAGGMVYGIDGSPWENDEERSGGFERADLALQRLMAGR